MTGYDEATEWLGAHAPDWRIRHSTATLEAGMTIGAPAQVRYEVELVTPSRLPRQEDTVVVGSGSTLVDAVQRALGGWV